MKAPAVQFFLAATATLIKCHVFAKFTFPNNDYVNLFSDVNVKEASKALSSLLLSSTKQMTKKRDGQIEEIGTGPNGGHLLRIKTTKEEVMTIASDEKRRNMLIQKKLKKDSKKGWKKANNKRMSKNPKTAAPKIKKWKKTEKPSSQNQSCTNLIAENGDWKTWHADITTFTPIFRPKTDSELSGLVTSSEKHGCKVRMMGASSSQDGMVMQRKEEKVIVLSLASHTTDIESWQDSINEETSTFRVGAGKSWYDVSALIRPKGFVLKSRSAGAFFSVGGVIANMVHGGGRSTGFMHDDVVRMLVLTSDGNFKEVEGEDLQFWRSSAGLLGMIIAIEMNMHSEAIPYVIGIDPSTGKPILDVTKGGLVMEKERTLFERPETEAEFPGFISGIVEKVYTTHATYDTAQFFFDFFSNSLAEYRTNFSGKIFSGSTGPFADIEKAAAYKTHTEKLSEINNNVSFTGAEVLDLTEETICETFCLPPSGPPPTGDGSPCEKIPSSSDPTKLLCEVPIEVSAALSISAQDFLDGMFDLASSTSNDGFFVTSSTIFDLALIIIPARALASALGTWYGVVSNALTSSLPNINYFPNSNLEFRFINPKETAVLNPIPVIEETKAIFNEKYAGLYGPEAFDLLMPPLPEGIPDGYVMMESPTIRHIFDKDVNNFFFAMQEAWGSMPTNPNFPYGDLVVKDCDAQNSILPCTEMSIVEKTKCCNPVIPTYQTHLGKAWGYGVDYTTTPTTGKMQPFKDESTIVNMFETGSKKNTVGNFNKKRNELNAGVFAGGAMMQWLDPTAPNTDYEVKMLDGQQCGSYGFQSDPDKECISDRCFDSKCV
eukprot:CAMPEP_0194305364 /NCGR_PEP_ID=MMETSP0171-20130528/2816_1 /TAXON_ID=218684 /ORGANISM="Corethron pennatum, Strain L29A3" /LENGTH=829 /DNA_ID=CAMNT_0039056875 /DNA_START=176 /DNA_END=2665 /DNA_ORIENTATION=+